MTRKAKPKAKPAHAAVERLRAAAVFQPSDCPPGETNWEYAQRILALAVAAHEIAADRLGILQTIVDRRVAIERGEP
jgi:hypothetical protein